MHDQQLWTDSMSIAQGANTYQLSFKIIKLRKAKPIITQLNEVLCVLMNDFGCIGASSSTADSGGGGEKENSARLMSTQHV